MSTTQW